jgi:hypothetical protein
LVALIAFGSIWVPATALAQQVTPTQEQYDNGVLGVSSGGTSSDDSGQIGSLPFTGLDVAAIAAIGIGLVGAGFAVRRASRSGENPGT